MPNSDEMSPTDKKMCEAGAFFHALPKTELCDHDFQGWYEFMDGSGGEQVCTKCGIGAMAHSLRTAP